MKKILSAVLALVMVLSLSAVAFAADTFVPSITYKDAPEVVVAQLIEEGKEPENVPEHCLIITPVAEAESEMDRLPNEMKLLQSVYDQLNEGTMKLPTGKLKKDLEPEEVVIRDLVDISWLCEETPSHLERLESETVDLVITFNMKGLKATDTIYVMTYKEDGAEAAGEMEWNPIKSVVNNGDGTITCTFAHLCPVAFIVDKSMPNMGVEFSMELMMWSFVLVASAAALVVVVYKRRKNA